MGIYSSTSILDGFLNAKDWIHQQSGTQLCFFFFLMLPYDVKTFVCQKLLVRFLFDRCPAHHPLKREVNCFSVGDIAAADRHSRYTIAVS